MRRAAVVALAVLIAVAGVLTAVAVTSGGSSSRSRGGLTAGRGGDAGRRLGARGGGAARERPVGPARSLARGRGRGTWGRRGGARVGAVGVLPLPAFGWRGGARGRWKPMALYCFPPCG